MRACLIVWILLMKANASEHIRYFKGMQEKSVSILFKLKEGEPQPAGFYLYRKSPSSGQKDFLVSLTDHEYLHPDYRDRIKISEWQNLTMINVTLLDLRITDTGLYGCHFTKEQPKVILHHIEVILHILDDADGCKCVVHSSVIATISAAVILLFFTLLGLFTTYYRKLKFHNKDMTMIPIYERMIAAAPVCEPSNRLMEQANQPASSPVYALPQKDKTPHCHYAVPRKLIQTSNTLKQNISPELTAEMDQNN